MIRRSLRAIPRHRLPMQAERIPRSRTEHESRAEMLAIRDEDALLAAVSDYRAAHDWAPAFVPPGSSIFAERAQRASSVKNNCILGMEVAHGADDKPLEWPPTYAGLRAAIAWCDSANGALNNPPVNPVQHPR